jgi:hypothetical protein
MANWWDDFWGGVTDLRHGTAKLTPLPGADSALGPGGAMGEIKDTVNLTKAIWLNVSDYRMWRSLGWLILGVIMMIAGFVIWNRKAIGSTAAKIGLA